MLLEIDLHVLQHLGFVFQCWNTYSHVIPIDHISKMWNSRFPYNFLHCSFQIFDFSNKIVLLILLRVFLYEPCVSKKCGSLKVESFLKSSLDLSLAQLSLEKIVNSSTKHVCSYCHTLHGAHKAHHGGQLLIKAVNSPTFVIRPSNYCLVSCNFYSTSNMVL